MNAAATTQTDSMPSDEALLAEIAPAMLAKLKADSRRESTSTAFLLMVVGGWFAPNLAKQLDNIFGLVVFLLGFAAGVGALVVLVRCYLGQPSMLRDELRYRRQHGKWRWDR